MTPASAVGPTNAGGGDGVVAGAAGRRRALRNVSGTAHRELSASTACHLRAAGSAGVSISRLQRASGLPAALKCRRSRSHTAT
eukprot:6970566-Prymnesium_polylepis.2